MFSTNHMHACVMQKERPQTGKEKFMESLIARVYHKHMKTLRSIYKYCVRACHSDTEYK